MTATDTQQLDTLCVDTVRTLSMDAVQKANSGHPGSPMALAPLAYVLYTRVMRHNPADSDWIDRDRFILSAGHASMLLYSSLYLAGYGLTLEDIENFRQLGSPTAGHPERSDAKGIEATTGPLGQGISMAVGLALAERMLAARFNTPDHRVVDHHTFVIASDGDIEEGIASEASSLAGHLGLGKLIVFYDANHIQLASPVSLVMSEDVSARYEAYGWHTLDLGDDMSVEGLEAAAAHDAMAVADKPSIVIMHSHIGYGSPHKQDTIKAHGSPLGEDEVRLTKEYYGWDPDKHFYVPDEALEHWRTKAGERGETQTEWQQRFDAYAQAEPDKAKLLQQINNGEMAEGWDADLITFDPADKPIATRAASGKTIQWAAAKVPYLVGGSADLASSNNTDIDGGGDVKPGDFSGRNLHFGVREHAMGAIANGLGLHGFRAYGGTFLTFSDYMRGAIRLSALMKLPSIWIYTHDSIGLGEDGPTHQPVEHLAALRAIPRLKVLRPADANETALAWRFALRTTDAPSAFALSRQNLPILDPAKIPDDAIERGAYVLHETKPGQAPELILIATGSEVSLILEAAEQLTDRAVRVVSMPCMDTFTTADDAYREAVLPKACKARIAVEAASPLGWDKWIGENGRFVGMTTFGESGPAPEVYEHFGITAARVVELGRELIGELPRMTTQIDEQILENPLVEGLERIPVGPTALIIFGATGDLAHRKLLPALYNLAHEGALPEHFELIGVSRRDQSDADYAAIVRDSIVRYSRRLTDPAVLEGLTAHVRYISGSFDDPKVYAALAATLDALDQQHREPLNRVFYLSTAPEFFPVICSALGEAGLHRSEHAETRVVIEKPFGYDLASARKLNAEVLSYFHEDQVFRIDHYLGKETVQNVMALRFANALFEPVWNRNFIDHVEITAAEDIGIGTRAGYYEGAGALRDLVQNHMLQLLALLAMEPPAAFEANRLRDEKLKVLEAIVPPTLAEVPTMSVRGQYLPGAVGGVARPGYKEEPGVAPDSHTETYVALRLQISNWRWAGVPFYLRTGKNLSRKLTEIAVILKPVPHLAFRSQGSVGVQANQIILTVQPDEGVSVSLGAKIPGPRMRIRPVNMEFRYGTSFLSQSPEAYERLILDAMRGDATLFTRNDEIEALWGIIDPILTAWRDDPGIPVAGYAAGTDGPIEAEQLAGEGRTWRRL